jgi:ssDNA-binding Zn-finger/Zn-ribbon topoisomerase 1
MTNSKESDLDRMRSKFEPGDKKGAFNACPECGFLWEKNAEALKEVARDEPSADAKTGRNERGSKRKSGMVSD